MKNGLFLLMILSFITTGCISNTTIDQTMLDRYLTKSFNCSKSKCYDATLAALNELKIDVDKQDRSKGIIITERVPFYELVQVTGNQYSASGQSFVATHKYYLQISGNKSTSTVKAYKYKLWKNNVEQNELNGDWCKENVWDPFFNEIQTQIDEM